MSKTRQLYPYLDALILNIERACQSAIDMAMHIVAKGHLGVPQGSADAFSLLSRNGLLEEDLAKRLRGMVGFTIVLPTTWNND